MHLGGVRNKMYSRLYIRLATVKMPCSFERPQRAEHPLAEKAQEPGNIEGSLKPRDQATHRTSPTISPASPCRLLRSSSTSRRNAIRLVSTKSRRSNTFSCPSCGKLGSAAASPASPGIARNCVTEARRAGDTARRKTPKQLTPRIPEHLLLLFWCLVGLFQTRSM